MRGIRDIVFLSGGAGFELCALRPRRRQVHLRPAATVVTSSPLVAGGSPCPIGPETQNGGSRCRKSPFCASKPLVDEQRPGVAPAGRVLRVTACLHHELVPLVAVTARE